MNKNNAMQEIILIRRNRNLASTVYLSEEYNRRFIVYFYKFIDGRPTYTSRPKSSEAYKSIIEYRK